MATLFNPQSSGTNTLTIREIGRNFYLNSLVTSPSRFLFGFGVPNINNITAQTISGNASGIFTVDNGIFGILYQYGALGVLLWTGVTIWLIGLSLKVFKRLGSIFYLAFIVFDLIGFVTIQPLFWRTFVTYSLFSAMLLSETYLKH